MGSPGLRTGGLSEGLRVPDSPEDLARGAAEDAERGSIFFLIVLVAEGESVEKTQIFRLHHFRLCASTVRLLENAISPF
jgi:hypothetical protein